jgi:phosphoglycolate phosphatase-like HAD superfamily hydrolase
MKNSVNTILFDFDGVIVDTFGISYSTMKKVTPNPPDEDGYRSWFNGNIYDKYEAKLEGDKVEEKDPFFKIWIPLLLQLEPVKGMVEVIKELHKHYRMVVISSTLGGPIREYLDKHDLSRNFDKIYGSDIHRSKVVKIKMVFDEFGIGQDNCVFITDTLGDMREATKMGIGSIGVTWGFQKIKSLQEGCPLAIADSPKDLAIILKR